MTTQTIRHGVTQVVTGTLAAGDRLIIQGGVAGGGAGAAAVVQTTASNAGLIDICGGVASRLSGQMGGLGGTLRVSGVLINGGTILADTSHASYGHAMNGGGATLEVSGTLTVLRSGSVVVAGASGRTHFSPAGSAAQFVNSGTVTNAGTVTLGGGGQQSYGGLTTAPAPAGATLTNTGTFHNTGSLLLQGSGATVGTQPAVGAAHFDDSGVLTNAGDVVIGGSRYGGGYYSNIGFGATLSVDGVLANTGSILVSGAAGSGARYVGYGYGGLLENNATLSNAGVIELAASVATYFGGGLSGTLVSSAMLTNTGTILLDGAQPTGLQVSRDGGYLDLKDVFQSEATNSGLLSIGGGGGSRYGAGGGGVLHDSSTLINTGTILVAGGFGTSTAYGAGGLGGAINVDGTLTNEGVITVGGGHGASLPGAFGPGAGLGGSIDITGILFNDGDLLLQGGTGGYAGGGTGASLTIGNLVVQNDSGTLTVGASQGGSSGVLLLNSELQNDPRSVVDNDGRIVFGANGGILDGTVHNTGVISGSGSLSELTFTNDGVLDVGSGDVLLAGDIISASVGGHGTLMVGTGGLLTIDSSTTIDDSQTVVLDDATAAVTISGSEAGVPIASTLGGSLDIVSPGDATLAADDSDLNVYLFSPADLTLSRMPGIDAFGSAGADRITSLSSGQTLTGRGGADVLIGAAATGDTFKDSAAGLSGDTIAGFAGSDVIDLTDLAPGAGLSVIYTQGSGFGVLTLSEAGQTASITLLGSFTQGQFTTASDGHGGVLIGLR